MKYKKRLSAIIVSASLVMSIIMPMSAFADVTDISISQSSISVENPIVINSFTATASASPSSPTVNQSTTITTNVTNTGTSYTGVIIDTEIYANNGAGPRVFQHAENLDGQTFAHGENRSFTTTWTPTTADTYRIKVGVFGSNWTPLLSWIDNAGSVTVTSDGGGNNASFSITATANPSQPNVNQTTRIDSTVSSKGNISNGIVDYEIYNASNNRVFQKFFENQDFQSTANKNYSFDWTPTSPGPHTLKGGIFSNNWSSNLYWNDNILSIPVGQGTTTPPSTSADVRLQTAYQTTFNPPIGSTNTLHAVIQNYTGIQRSVLVDLELFDPSNNRIANQTYDNVSLSPYNVANLALTSPNLQASGTYSWKISIYNLGRSSLIATYPNALMFTVPGTPNPSGTVILKASALGEAHMNNCPPVTAVVQNISLSPRNVLMDFELRNASGNLVNQYFVDHYTVGPAIPQSLMNVCNTTLSSGQYNYSIGIFNPGWNGLINWYNNVQSFSK